MHYLYDETFNGLLTCVYEFYYSKKVDNILPLRYYQGDLISEHKIIITDDNKAEKVYNAIEEKISMWDLGRIYKIFSSSDPNKELVILRYLRKGFKEGPKIRLLHSNQIVYDAQMIEKKVNLEVHRLCGLIRFSVVESNQNSNEILYSGIEPDNDVVEFLADHFCDRFKNEPFIIHDKRRKKALVSASGEWYVAEMADTLNLCNTQGEIEHRRLWKMYFDTIAIKERTNPKCQKNFMPVRYWNNLSEFKNEREI